MSEGLPKIGDIKRAGVVTIVGRPNVGKSTLLNALVGEDVAITAPVPQTTRDQIRGILSHDDWQIVFVDTPGIHDANKALNRVLVRRAIDALVGVDAVVLVVDGADYASGRILGMHRHDRRIMDLLNDAGAPVVCVINKVDRVRAKPKLLPMAEMFGAEPAVQRILFLSAEAQDGTQDLLDDLKARLPEGPALYDPEIVSDATVRFAAAEIVRERIFRQMREEIPYATAIEIERFDESVDPIEILARIVVEKPSQKGIVIGHEGDAIKRVRLGAQRRISRMLGQKVHLELHVSVSKDWSRNEKALKRLGYE